MTNVQERYTPLPLAANASTTLTGVILGGFIAVTAGTVTVTTQAGVVVVNAVPVAAGAYLPLPILLPSPSAVVALAGGASGTLLV